MSEHYEVIDRAGPTVSGAEELAYEVLVGLSSTPKRLPSRYFYDDAGSALFARIMRLPEYYPTACERAILEAHGGAITGTMSGPFNLVDLGAGDGDKTLILLRDLVARDVDVVYVPIDISEGAMQGLVARVRKELPTLKVQGLVGEYAAGVRWLAANRQERANLILFLGSNVGNFDMASARGFLGRLWAHMRLEDRLVVGFDLKKDIEKLLAAYNDSEGVTAEFNLNLLRRINRELGADFDVSGFRHFGTYDVKSGAMKSYLVSLERQEVRVEALERSFVFDPWEPIHTEYSYKYLRTDVDQLAEDSGFVVAARHEDPRGWFMDDVWKPRRSPKLGS